MQETKLQKVPLTYKFDAAKLDKAKMAEAHLQVPPTIPKIRNKEIPLHHLGPSFNRTFLKDKNYRSKVWYVQQKKQRKNVEQMNKTFHSRPVHLLKEYLGRKQKFKMDPMFVSDPEEETFYAEDKPMQFNKTTRDFRIKKTHHPRNLSVEPQIHYYQNEEEMQTSKMASTDRDFATFNSKNLYDMTIQELQESMQWKKNFLHLLNTKYAMETTRQNSLRSK